MARGDGFGSVGGVDVADAEGSGLTVVVRKRGGRGRGGGGSRGELRRQLGGGCRGDKRYREKRPVCLAGGIQVDYLVIALIVSAAMKL